MNLSQHISTVKLSRFTMHNLKRGPRQGETLDKSWLSNREDS